MASTTIFPLVFVSTTPPTNLLLLPPVVTCITNIYKLTKYKINLLLFAVRVYKSIYFRRLPAT